MNNIKYNFLTGKEKNKTRAMLRKALVAGELEARRTYHDYYDSCHAPSETPNAPWLQACEYEHWNHNPNKYPIRISDLKSKPYSPSIYKIDEHTFELSTGYHRIEVRFRKNGV